MTKAEREALQKRIKNYYNQHSGRSKAAVVKHKKKKEYYQQVSIIH